MVGKVEFYFDLKLDLKIPRWKGIAQTEMLTERHTLKRKGIYLWNMLKALIVNDSYQRVTTKDSLDIKWWLRTFTESGILPGNG